MVLAVTLNNKIIAREKMHKRVRLNDWDEKAQRTREDEALNLLIEKRINELKQEFTRRQLLNEALTETLIKKIVDGEAYGGSFYEFAEHIISTKKLKDGLPYDNDTKRRYRNETDRMQLFRKDLQVHQVTFEFLTKYKEWMQFTYVKADGKKLHKNSIWKALSFIRMICNDAIKAGLMPAEIYPFRDFDIGTCETDISKIKYL